MTRTPKDPVFVDPVIEAALKDWSALVQRHHLTNGQILGFLVAMVEAHLLPPAPSALREHIVDALASGDLTSFLKMAKVRLQAVEHVRQRRSRRSDRRRRRGGPF